MGALSWAGPALLAVFLVLLTMAPASGFAAVPLPSVHQDITEAAADRAGWPQGARAALVVAVHAPDLEEVQWDPQVGDPARFDLRPEYKPSHHCDRVPPADDRTSLADAAQYIRTQADHAPQARDVDALIEALGNALHALQDCYSHSDYVDLGPAHQAAFTAYILGGPGTGAAPEARLVAVQPEIEDPGMPDDPYPHDLYAKDSPDFNDEASTIINGTTKHQAAKQAATNASALLIEDVLARLTPAMRQALDDVRPEGPDRWPVPTPVAGVVLVTGIAASCRRRNA